MASAQKKAPTKGGPSKRATPSKRAIAREAEPLRLDLACGPHKQEGFHGVDRSAVPGVDTVMNLLRFPWPWAHSSVDEARCSHFIEHIPMIEVDSRGVQVPFGEGLDLLIAFFNELHRVMKPGAQATIISPYYASMAAWQDPTHRRAISEATYFYLNEEWRIANGLEHYGITANFQLAYAFAIEQNWNLRPREEQEFAMRSYNNVAMEIHATLTCVKD